MCQVGRYCRQCSRNEYNTKTIGYAYYLQCDINFKGAQSECPLEILPASGREQTAAKQAGGPWAERERLLCSSLSFQCEQK
jgi:hypothetical protein